MAAVLSCIMPVYNGEEYLEKSVQSVLDQSFAWFELILVNDGSTDRTADLCAEFARKDERVRVLTQTNKGAAAARNAGIQASEGRYITFVDADDVLLPKAFEKTVQAMENRELDLVSFNFSFWQRHRASPRRCTPPFPPPRWRSSGPISSSITGPTSSSRCATRSTAPS